MRKLTLILLLVCLSSGIAYSGPRVLPARSGDYHLNGVSNINVSVTTDAALLYNVTFVANANNAVLEIADEASTSALKRPVLEVKVATSGNSHTVDMSAAPLNFDVGLMISATNGTAYINYQN